MADRNDWQWRNNPAAAGFTHLIDAAEEANNLPRDLLGAVLHRESRFNPEAVSPAGAVGIAQLMPIHNDAVGDPRDPLKAIPYAAGELSRLHSRFGSWDKATAAYNMGETRLQGVINRFGDQWLDHVPEETRAYSTALTPPDVSVPSDDVGTEHLDAPEESIEQLEARLQQKELAEQQAIKKQIGEIDESQRLDQLHPEGDQQVDENTYWAAFKERSVDFAKAPAKGIIDGVNETFIAAKDIARWLIPLDSLVLGKEQADAHARGFNEAARDRSDELIAQPETTLGQITKDVTQFLTVYGEAGKAITATRDAAGVVGKLGNTAEAALQGALADFAGFNPDDPVLANLLQKYPALSPIKDVLATDPNDEESINRLRRAVEGLGLGQLAEGIIKLVRMGRASRFAKEQTKEFDEVAPHEGKTLEEPKVEEPKVEEPKAEEPKADEAKPDEAKAETPDPQSPDAVKQIEKTDAVEKVKDAIKIDPAKRAEITEALVEGKLSKVTELIDFNGKYVDNAFENAAKDGDPIGMFNTFSEALRQVFDSIPRAGVVSWKETAARAKALGMDVSGAAGLYRKTKGLDHEILAQDLLMHASGARLQRLAKEAKALNPRTMEGVKARAAVAEHVEMHAALMAHVRQSKREVARALNAMKIFKIPDEDLFREFEGLTSNFRGMTDDARDALLDKILKSKTTRDLGGVVDANKGLKWTDVLSEYVINNMLSSPKTQIANLISNSIMVAMHGTDRIVAATIVSPIRQGIAMATGKKIEAYTLRQAGAYWSGVAHGMWEGTKLAGQVLWNRAPTDAAKSQKYLARRAIRIDPTDLTGPRKVMATVVNVLGEIQRLPGVGLMAGDELFQAIARRASTQEHAFMISAREADKQGLTGRARKAFIEKDVKSVLKDPPPELLTKAKEDAAYATFQEPATTAWGKASERWINANPIFKLLVAPFFKTPTNIMRQTFVDRTPLALFNEKLTKDLMAGDARSSVAVARMFSAVSAMTAAYFMFAEKKRLMGKQNFGNSEAINNIPSYSIQLTEGGDWYEFNRLDPVGGWFGAIAEWHDFIEKTYDPHDEDSVNRAAEVTAALAMATARNVLSKTWASSVYDLLDAFDPKGRDTKMDTMKDKIGKVLGSQAQKLVPGSGLQRSLAGTGDPVLRDAQNVMQRLQRDGLGDSQELPAMRDWLGRPVERHNVENYWWNPIQAAPDTKDPLEKELVRLSFDFTPLPRSISVRGSGSVKLNPEQYGEFKRLIGQEPLQAFGGVSLEQQLRALVQSDYYKNDLSDDDGETAGSRQTVIKNLYSVAKAEAQGRLLAKYTDLDKARTDLVKKKNALLTSQ